MTSRRETVLAALAAALATQARPVARNLAVPVTIPHDGLAILHDGDPGRPEITLSPMTWHYRHRAELDVMVTDTPAAQMPQTGPPAAADRFDAICAEIGAAIAADRTLGGTCDWAEAEAPVPSQVAPEGAAPVFAATIGIILHYATTDPLG